MAASPPKPQTEAGDPDLLDPAPKAASLEVEGRADGDPPAVRGWGEPMGRPPRRPPARTRVRNRRYAALRQLIQAGEYFSEEEMRWREPLLYQHYIGQYQGFASQTPPSNCLGTPVRGKPPHETLTGLLLRSVEEEAVQQRLQQQLLQDGESDEEEEVAVPDEAERAMLRQEFTSHMFQRFLDGEDGDFDYSQIDENPDLDNLDIVSRDAEERYFDEEEPSEAPQLE